jgi:hypothetical protein
VVLQTGDGFGLASWQQLLLGVAITTVSWVLVALFGPETDREVLVSFATHIKPGGPGWSAIVSPEQMQAEGHGSDIPTGLLAAATGAVGIYSALFATGYFLYGQRGMSAVMAILSIGAFILLSRLWSKLRFE